MGFYAEVLFFVAKRYKKRWRLENGGRGNVTRYLLEGIKNLEERWVYEVDAVVVAGLVGAGDAADEQLDV